MASSRRPIAVFMTNAGSSRRGMLHFVPACDQDIGFEAGLTMPPVYPILEMPPEGGVRVRRVLGYNHLLKRGRQYRPGDSIVL
ncbi:hypothetical protein LA080_004426 [Diaporthe eres]|nr:hypothetical protein LA080_004426 [Diaporthe eres]